MKQPFFRPSAQAMTHALTHSSVPTPNLRKIRSLKIKNGSSLVELIK